VTAAARGERVTLEVRGEPFGPSDHSSFYGTGVPVLFFHTGGHDDYHKPTDTADKLNADGMAVVARIGAGIVERLASGPPPAYAKLTRPPRPRRSGSEAFLGVATDPQAAADGLWLSGVVPGSAAARAGVQEGDVILRLAGIPIDSFDELRGVLRGKRPGDTVLVVYLRNGTEHVTSATLDARP
jgi:S1-C subfamily serine protease